MSGLVFVLNIWEAATEIQNGSDTNSSVEMNFILTVRVAVIMSNYTEQCGGIG